jgi:enamine deaminase RidA (YjgF/YER057c/UK114 family)
MSGLVAKRLEELGIELPEPHAPPANFVGAVLEAGFIHVSGQGPVLDGALAHIGKVPTEQSLEDAKEAARLTAINILAQASKLLDGNLDRVIQVVKLFGLVNCTTELDRPSKAIDVASQLFIDVFGPQIGAHPRVAISAQSLPFGMTCEIDAVLQIRD